MKEDPASMQKEICAALFQLERAAAAFRAALLKAEWPPSMECTEAQAFREARLAYEGALSRLTLAINKAERRKLGVSREQFAQMKNGTYREDVEIEA